MWNGDENVVANIFSLSQSKRLHPIPPKKIIYARRNMLGRSLRKRSSWSGRTDTSAVFIHTSCNCKMILLSSSTQPSWYILSQFFSSGVSLPPACILPFRDAHDDLFFSFSDQIYQIGSCNHKMSATQIKAKPPSDYTSLPFHSRGILHGTWTTPATLTALHKSGERTELSRIRRHGCFLFRFSMYDLFSFLICNHTIHPPKKNVHILYVLFSLIVFENFWRLDVL